MSRPDRPVAPRPFVDRPAGNLAASQSLADRLADAHHWPRPVLLRDGSNAIFRAGAVLVRVARPTNEPAGAYALADWLAGAGIRVTRPIHERPVLVEPGADRPRLAATAWEFVVTAAGDPDWAEVGEMVRRLHGLAPSTVPAGYPVPPATAFSWWEFDRLLSETEHLVDPAAHAGLTIAVDTHRDWPERSGGPDRWVLCHGDLHHRNVIAGDDGPVIVDWDLMCVGPPGWDHAPLLAMVEHWGVAPSLYERYAAGYGADLRTDPVTESLTVLRSVAATLLRVVAEGETAPPTGEAAKRLAFWRGDPDAPTWTFV